MIGEEGVQLNHLINIIIFQTSGTYEKQIKKTKHIFWYFLDYLKEKKILYLENFSHTELGILCTLDLYQWLVLLLKSHYQFRLVNLAEGGLFIGIWKTAEEGTKMCK